VVAHHGAHHNLGHIAERALGVAIAEEILDRVGNAVLDNPLHVPHIEVTGEHERFIRKGLRAETCPYPRLLRAEAKLGFPDTLHFHLAHRLQSQGQAGVEAWRFPPHISPKALHHGHLIRLHGVKHRPHHNEAKQDQQTHEESAWWYPGYPGGVEIT
jgi:hypothetical protein